MPHCKSDAQFEIFDAAPQPGELSPRLELPFQPNQSIDVARVAKIFAISKQTANRIVEKGLLRRFRIGQSWLVEYNSVVDYCNHLRVHYRISEDRLLRKPVRGRLRDEDLLPFPIADTMLAKEVQQRLSIPCQGVINLIEQGDLTGYQILIESGGPSPWRIYRPSLDRYLASLHVQASARPAAHAY